MLCCEKCWAGREQKEHCRELQSPFKFQKFFFFQKKQKKSEDQDIKLDEWT